MSATLATTSLRVGRWARAASRWAAGHRRATLALGALFTLLPLAGLARLRTDTDGHALVPRDDPAVQLDRELRRRFDLRDQIVVYFDSGREDGIFDPHLLSAVRDVTDALATVPEIGRDHVQSLATATRQRLYPGSGQSYAAFLDVVPASRRELAELRHDLELPSARLLTGTLVTADRRGVAVLAGVPDGRDRRRLVGEVERIVAPHRRAGLAVDVVGAPVASARLVDHLTRDLLVLVPLSLLVAAAVTWLGTRRAAAVVLVMAKAGLGIGWTFAVLGWLGIPLYLTAAVVPIVLTAASMADELHLVMRYQRALAGGATDPLGTTTDSLALPVVAATLTTGVGFLACTTAPIAPIRALGVACSLGMLWALLFSLLLTPAVLAALPSRWLARAPRPAAAPLRERPVRSPRLVLAVTAAITPLALAGVARLRIQDSWIESFAPRSELRLATERVNRHLFGVHQLHLVTTWPAQALMDPAAVATVARLEDVPQGLDTVGGVVGAATQLRTAADFWGLREMATRRDMERLYHRFELAPGPVLRRRAVSDAYDGAVVTVFLTSANFRATARLVDAVRRFEREQLLPRGASLALAGDVAVSQAMIGAIVRSQLASLPLALGGVFLTALLLCGSWRLAACAVLPPLVSGLWMLGALGWSGVPLGVATSMFFAISIGLGVDSHAIHLVARFGEVGDVARSVAETRWPIVVNALAVAGGFGLLALSAVPPNRRLGLLIAGGIASGCIVTLTALPALLELVGRARGRETAARASGEEIVGSLQEGVS